MWFWSGKSGNVGRKSRHEYDSESAAAEGARGYVATMIADGFELIDPARTITGPKLPTEAPVTERPLKDYTWSAVAELAVESFAIATRD